MQNVSYWSRSISLELKLHMLKWAQPPLSSIVIHQKYPGSNLGRCGTPQKWTFRTQKVDFLNLTPSTLPQKPHFWPTLWVKVDLLPDLGGGGGALHPLHPPFPFPNHKTSIRSGAVTHFANP